MRVISEEEKQRIIELYMAECTIQQITHETGRCRQTIRKILREAGCLPPEKKRTGLSDADRMWLRRVWHWKLPEPRRDRNGKYRVVHPGDKGVRTPYRPDGKFQ